MPSPRLGFLLSLGFCSADDVAVLVHDDLLAVGEGDTVKTVANAVGLFTAVATGRCTDNRVAVQDRTER